MTTLSLDTYFPQIAKLNPLKDSSFTYTQHR